MQKYKEIFTKIENTLFKESGLSEEEFKSEFGKFKDYENRYQKISDDEIFCNLVSIIFYYNRLDWVVSKKLPKTTEYFKDFRKVKNYSNKEIKQIMDDPETLHYEQRIKFCINNAKEFENIINDNNGKFKNYLEKYRLRKAGKGIDNLKSELIENFNGIGNVTSYHFLTDMGFKVLKPDRVICRLFKRIGLIENENNIEQAVIIGKKMSEVTGHWIRYIDIILVTYGQEPNKKEKGYGICISKEPKCSVCGVKRYCEYYVSNYR